MIDWRALTWPERRVADAVYALATSAGLCPLAPDSTAQVSESEDDGESTTQRVETAADALGLDALPVDVTFGDISDAGTRLSPALVRIALDPPLPLSQVEQVYESAATEFGYLVLLRSTRRRVTVISSELQTHELELAQLSERLTREATARPAALIDTWLEQAQISRRRWPRARMRLLRMLLAEDPIGGIWILRRDPSARLSQSLGSLGWFRHVAVFFSAAGLQTVCSMLAWSVLGRAVLGGEIASGWLQAWVLLSCTAIVFQVWTVWAGGRSGLILSAVLKQRLLCGALRIDAGVIRERGSGGLLAMVDESEAVERAGLDGTFTAFVAVLQLAGAGIVLAFGSCGLLNVTLLGSWCVVVAVIALGVTRRLGIWTDQRFGLSTLFVERVQGHRTRLAQGNPAHWHVAEDASLECYASSARSLDTSRTLLAVLPARGWLAVASLGLAAVLSSQPTPVAMALTIGAFLQAQNAFARLSQSLSGLLEAAVAWRSVRTLFQAAKRPAAARVPSTMLRRNSRRRDSTGSAAPPATALELRAVSFGYGESARLALRDCNMTVREGDRWLLDGASGSGKSTLAKVLTGMCKPVAGLVLLDGLDYATLGPREWRKRIASAPQFHENYLLSAPLSFNLLMGRAWPPSAGDLAEALETCRALGLGPLIRRMPSGLQQIVGETGWQLSHGERSRVFLARALLQRASVVVLDESFGALDPDTLKLCMQVVRDRINTLVVIAHP